MTTPTDKGSAHEPTESMESGPEVRRPTAALLVLSSPDESQTDRAVRLDIDSISVGRAGDWAISDRRISRVHARFTWLANTGGCMAEDLGSRNGLRVNGQAVDRVLLEGGEVVRLGDTFMTCLIDDDDAPEPSQPMTPMVARSAESRRILSSIQRVAATGLRVLIMGESGVGKEVLAQELHACSGRKGPLVPINCGAIPSALAESVLFGHRKGAFTGADRDSVGLVKSANAGTLFLDEVGELHLDIQVKLLRVLESGEVRPVGSTSTTAVDLRVVSATNRDLFTAVEEGKFRGDLFARLAEWVVVAPPLRERKADILPLFELFVRRRQGAWATPRPDAVETLLTHGWTYNVRELERVAKVVSVNVKPGTAISRSDLPKEVFERPTFGYGATERDSSDESLADRAPPTDDELRSLLRLHKGCVADVAYDLGRHRNQIYRWLKRFHIDLDEYRS